MYVDRYIGGEAYNDMYGFSWDWPEEDYEPVDED